MIQSVPVRTCAPHRAAPRSVPWPVPDRTLTARRRACDPLVHLPEDPPAALFWAVTAYNITDGTMTEAAQLMPSINGMNKVKMNEDGTIDLYFSPEKPADVAESNWIQTVKGRAVLIALRLYGSGVEFYDQTWKPDDVVKVK